LSLGTILSEEVKPRTETAGATRSTHTLLPSTTRSPVAGEAETFSKADNNCSGELGSEDSVVYETPNKDAIKRVREKETRLFSKTILF
jgi:hypothetical protein